MFQLLPEAADFLDQRRWNGLPGIFPDHGAQLGLDMKGDAMIDAPQPALLVLQNMPTFTIRVVDDDIKGGNTLKGLVVRAAQREVVRLQVGVDKQLHRADAILRSFPQHGRRHDRPAERRADQVRSRFPLA